MRFGPPSQHADVDTRRPGLSRLGTGHHIRRTRSTRRRALGGWALVVVMVMAASTAPEAALAAPQGQRQEQEGEAGHQRRSPFPESITRRFGVLPKMRFEPLDLERAVSPVETGRISSGFGYRRARRRRRRQFHAGLDFAAERGSPVLAARRGIVTQIASDADRSHGFLGYGNAVVVYHPEDDRFSFYAHLSEVLVEVGQGLHAGQKLGRVGNTTNRKFRGMASHLHFEVRERMDDGRSPFPSAYSAYTIDPLDWLTRHGMELGHHRSVGLAMLAETR